MKKQRRQQQQHYFLFRWTIPNSLVIFMTMLTTKKIRMILFLVMIILKSGICYVVSPFGTRYEPSLYYQVRNDPYHHYYNGRITNRYRKMGQQQHVFLVNNRKESQSMNDLLKGMDALPKQSNGVKSPPLPNYSPIPVMPSPLFQQLALSQLELLATALPKKRTTSNRSGSSNNNNNNNNDKSSGSSKIKSMALYLPQENVHSGQLEFVPAILYPHPNNERVFIANDANSGLAPVLPRTLTKLPGFAHATSLLPNYPLVWSTSTSSSTTSDRIGETESTTASVSPSSPAGVGIVEEVLCDIRMGGTALSVPLFSGSQTVGVLLVSPAVPSRRSAKYGSDHHNNTDDHEDSSSSVSSFWTESDRLMVSKTAQSLSLALSLDSERNALRTQTEVVYESLSDSLHQFKNPLQALRTFGKLLQQRIADMESEDELNSSSSPNGMGGSGSKGTSGKRNSYQLLELAEHLMVQSDRLVERLKPVDAIVEALGEQRRPLAALNPVPNKNQDALVPWRAPYLLTDPDQVPAKKSKKRKDTQSNANSIELYPNVTEEVFSPSNNFITSKSESSYNVSNDSVLNDSYEDSNNNVKKKKRTTKRRSTTVNATSSQSEDNRVDKNDATTNLSRNQAIPMMTTTTTSPPPPLTTPTSRLLFDTNREYEMSFVLDVLDPIFTTYRAIAYERGIGFSVVTGTESELPGVRVSPEGLQEAISNVLDNAIKYVVLPKQQQQPGQTTRSLDNDVNQMNPNPQVRVQLFPNKKPLPSGVTIWIEDNGPGILPVDRLTVFERGFRATYTEEQNVEGSGLGLYIARSFIEVMGGTITMLDPIPPRTLDGTLIECTLYRQPRPSP